MLGFPQKTELRKPLHKKAIFDRLKLNKAQQDRVDADISRLWFVNEISPFSVGIAAGEEVKAFFVILVSLKSKEYDDKTIAMLFRMIDNKMILVLEYEGESRVAIFHGKLIQTDWNPTESYSYSLQGLNLDSVRTDVRAGVYQRPQRLCNLARYTLSTVSEIDLLRCIRRT